MTDTHDELPIPSPNLRFASSSTDHVTDAHAELPIPPDLYQQTLERLQLRTVSLEEVHSWCDREALGEGGITVGVTDETFAQEKPTRYLAYIYYHLTGMQNGEATLRLDARYCLTFDTDGPVPPGFFDVFRELNLKMTTLPFFRELVASVTGRMEIPTLILPYSLFVEDGGEEILALSGGTAALSAPDAEG